MLKRIKREKYLWLGRMLLGLYMFIFALVPLCYILLALKNIGV